MKKVAIVGGNAKAIILSGGGSASLKPSYFVSPYEGIVNALKEQDPNIQVVYSEGARSTYSPRKRVILCLPDYRSLQDYAHTRL